MTQDKDASTASETRENAPVWFSDCAKHVANYGAMRCLEREGREGDATAWAHRRVRFPNEEIPLGLRDLSGRYGKTYADYMPDFFTTGTSLITVSEKLHDLLVQFDMGDNQLVELPFYDFDKETLRPERFWMLALAARKQELDVEHSSIGPDGIYENGGYTPLPDNVLTPYTKSPGYLCHSGALEEGNGQIAYPASVREGADLWGDPMVKDLMFFSDRLKRAIEGAKLKIKHMPFHQLVLTDEAE